jgi:hypothetical protein
MKKRLFFALLGCLAVAGEIQALDPVAPVSERKYGVVYVKSTLPSSDVITLTDVADPNHTMTLKSETDAKVPVGDYTVRVEMQDYSYEVEVSVRPTERHEIVVPGFGNLRINGPKANVEVFEAGEKKPIAKFASNYTKTLPKGTYDVVISWGVSKKKDSITQRNVVVVTNTTRQIDFNF